MVHKANDVYVGLLQVILVVRQPLIKSQLPATAYAVSLKSQFLVSRNVSNFYQNPGPPLHWVVQKANDVYVGLRQVLLVVSQPPIKSRAPSTSYAVSLKSKFLVNS